MKKLDKTPPSIDPNMEKIASDLEINRRLTKYLADNAVRQRRRDFSVAKDWSGESSIWSQYLALCALMPLLVCAWAYFLFFETPRGRS
jgi:hypothetical protein